MKTNIDENWRKLTNKWPKMIQKTQPSTSVVFSLESAIKKTGFRFGSVSVSVSVRFGGRAGWGGRCVRFRFGHVRVRLGARTRFGPVSVRSCLGVRTRRSAHTLGRRTWVCFFLLVFEHTLVWTTIKFLSRMCLLLEIVAVSRIRLHWVIYFRFATSSFRTGGVPLCAGFDEVGKNEHAGEFQHTILI